MGPDAELNGERVSVCNLIGRNLILPPVVESGRSGAIVVNHLLGYFELSAVAAVLSEHEEPATPASGGGHVQKRHDHSEKGRQTQPERDGAQRGVLA